MLPKVPAGMSATGCGTVTRAALGGVLELNMIAFVADLKPAIGLESFYDLPAIHENSIHIDTHSGKGKANYKLHNLAEKFRSV